MIYSILDQLPQIERSLNRKLPFQTDPKVNKYENMVNLRHKAAKFAQEKLNTYKSDIEKKLGNAKNLPISTEAERVNRQQEISKYTALLRDTQKEQQAINDLNAVHRDLDICGEEGKYLSMYLDIKIAVLSEYNPKPKDNTIGCFFIRLPDGNASMYHYSETPEIQNLLKNTVNIYHTGNDKGGHYQAIM